MKGQVSPHQFFKSRSSNWGPLWVDFDFDCARLFIVTPQRHLHANRERGIGSHGLGTNVWVHPVEPSVQ